MWYHNIGFCLVIVHWFIYITKYQNNFVDTSLLDEEKVETYMFSEVAVLGLLGAVF